MVVKLHALHGFLGRPQDWEFLGPNVTAHDVLKVGQPSKNFDMWQWAEKFNHLCRGEPNVPRILMGYSLGGRLALHALLQNASLWHGAVIISSSPSMLTDRSQRLLQDQQWAERFETESWKSVIDAWNQRDVFCHATPPFERREEDFSRQSLANILRYWSLAHQEDLVEALSQLKIPILWVAGENDSRYAAQANALQLQHVDSRKWIAPKSGHRVPWECQNQFCLQLERFIDKLKESYAYRSN